MEKEYKNNTVENIIDLYEDYTWAKISIIVIGSFLGIFILGKAAHILAGSLRGFRNLKNAMNGN